MNLGNVTGIDLFTFGTGKTWAETAANTSAEQTTTVPGLRVGDVVTVNKPTAQAGIGVVNARVSAADTLAITFMNSTASGVTSTALEEWSGVVFRSSIPLATNVTI